VFISGDFFIIKAREMGITWAIEPRFDEIRDFAAHGLAAVRISGKWGYIREPSR
jgi:hypothetical protein